MYLKRLQIHGFKSFAEQTVLDFLPPKNGHFSITAIVGPNGSGKSNVTDAIRWVMGETSMKMIRGKKSEDIIFNGSDAKGALSFAEVTMVLDNREDKVGIGAEDLVITRRLYRTGESEYLVNQNTAKLLDIHLLLAKAQFAEHAYSIVSQGMIDRLLTVSPLERKEFFDEASGIKEFQIKHHQATLKLARSEENMDQAETLLKEVEPRLKLLSRQVKKLEERQELEVTLMNAQEQYYFTLYSRTKQEIDGLAEQLKKVEETYRQFFQELENIQQELATSARASTRQETFDKLQTRHQDAVRLQNNLERDLAILEGQLHTEYSNAGKQNISWLEQKKGELKTQQTTLTQQLAALGIEASRFEKTLKDHEQKLEALQVAKTQAALKISRIQNQLVTGQSEQNYLHLSGLTAVKAVLEAKSKFGKVHGLVAELGEVSEEYQLALEVAAGQHVSSIVVEDETVARRAIDYLREHKYGVATFLPLQKIQPRTLFREEQDYLGSPELIDLALNLIHFDEKFRTIFSFIFGSTFVVKDLKAAERLGIGKLRMVTLAGDLVEKNSVMKGGFRGRRFSLGFSSKIKFGNDDRVTEDREELLKEQQHLVDLEQTIETVKAELSDAQVAVKTYASQQEVLRVQLNSVQGEYARLEQELTLIESSPEEYGSHLKKLAEDKEVLIKKIAQAEQEVDVVAKEIEAFNKKEEEKKQYVFKLQEAMQAKQLEVNATLAERNELRIQLAKLETKQEDLAQEVQNDMNTPLASLIERISKAEVATPEGLEQLAQQIQKLKYQLSLIGGIDQEVTKEYSETKERYDFLSSQLHDLRTACENLTKMIVELDEIMKKKRSVAFKKIRKEFNRYFQILFEGGSADLEEVYGEVAEEDSTDPATVPPPEANPESLLAEDQEEGSKKRKQEKILTGIAGSHISGENLKGVVALKKQEVTREDISRAVESARTLAVIPHERRILHVIPREFMVLMMFCAEVTAPVIT
jgi:chromosome segregation protein